MESLICGLAAKLCDGLGVHASAPGRRVLEQAARLALLAVVYAWQRSLAEK